MTIQWRPVVGYEGRYSVSSNGDVRRDAPGPGATVGRILKPYSVGVGGHHSVTLTLDGFQKKYLVHRLVLIAFRGEPPVGMEGCHNNGDPADNRLENLRWDSHSGNMLDVIKHGRHNYAHRSTCVVGHLLEVPNLIESELRRRGGSRSCKACHRAKKYARYYGLEFDPAIANAKYAEITGSN